MGIHLIIRTQFGKRKVPVTFASKVTGTFILSANIEKYEKEVRNASGDYEEMEDKMHIFLVFHFVLLSNTYLYERLLKKANSSDSFKSFKLLNSI